MTQDYKLMASRGEKAYVRTHTTQRRCVQCHLVKTNTTSVIRNWFQFHREAGFGFTAQMNHIITKSTEITET